MTSYRFLKPLLSLLLATIFTGFVQALDVYHVGNSLTNTSTPRGIQNIAEGAGYEHDYYILQSAGAPLWFNWPKGENIEPMSSRKWDAMTLQPFHFYDREYRFADYYIKAMRGEAAIDQQDPPAMPPGPDEPTGMSPDVVVYIYEQARPEFIRSGQAMEEPYREDMNAYYWVYLEKMVNELRADNPGVTIRKIPASQAVHELNQRIMAGEVPGVSHLDEVFLGIHPNDVGGYILGLSFYASIYQTNPIGAPMPSEDYLVPEELVLPFQESVWTVVSRDPQVGIAQSLVIRSHSLPRGLYNTAYSAQLEGELADGAVTWSIAEGSLPAGLALAEDGALTGTPTEFGVFPITFRAEDAGANADERRLFLFVDSDDPPVIDTAQLNPVPWGSYVEQRLEASYGVPPYTWAISRYELPRGMELTADGLLKGVPYSPQGIYDFQVQVTDSSTASTSVTRDITLEIGGPEVGTAISYKTNATIAVDGILDEAAWVLAGTANHVREPGSDNTATWGVLWDETNLYFAVNVIDAQIIHDSEDLRQDDAVQIFLDALHDRESDYNADDRQIVVTADGRFAELNDRPAEIVTAAADTAEGYQMEIAIPWSNLQLTPADIFSLGLDVGVVDDDDGGDRDGYTVWLGGRDNPPIPSEFGNLILSAYGLANNLLGNSGFTPPPADYTSPSPNEEYEALPLGYPNEIIAAHAQEDWLVGLTFKSNFFRFARRSDKLGIGFPGNAAWAYGDPDSRNGSLAQLVADGKSSVGPGLLSFDLRNPSAVVNLRVYGYNAPDDTALNDKLAARVRDQNPIDGGSFDAELLATSLDPSVLGLDPGSDHYQRVNLPIDFGSGYDFLLLAFSSTIAEESTLYTFIDNIEMGPRVSGMEMHYGSPTGAELTLETLIAETTEGQSTDPLRFRVTRDVIDNFAHPFELRITASGQAVEADLVPVGSLAIPPRESSVIIDLRAKADAEVEGDETATFQLVPGGSDSTTAPEAATTIREHPLDSWLRQHHGNGPYAYDTDGDLMPDHFEFACGSDPLDPNSRGNLSLRIVPNLAGEATVEGEISLQSGISQVVEVSMEVSPDLIHWSRYPVSSSVLQETGQTPGTYGNTHSYFAENIPALSNPAQIPAAFARWTITPR